MLLPPRLPPPSLPRAKVYRLFLQHLRFLPDPQVWTTTVPRFRKLLETPGPSPSGSNPADNDGIRKVNEIREWRREKAMKKAHKPRARKRMPACRLRKQAQRLVQRDWNGVQPPIYLPPSSETKDDVDKKERTMVNNLRILAGLSEEPTSPLTSGTALDLSPLSSNLSRFFPTNPRRIRSLPLPPYPPPRPKHTRSNPHTWSLPRKLCGRLVRRTYKRLWDKLVWVRPVEGDKWKKCGYRELQDWEQGLIEESLVKIPDSNKGKKSKKERAIERMPKNIDSSKWSCATPEDRQWLSFGKMQTS
ncbi:hypothetical protein I305_02656 [Cryptococcus gattii E566]|uniref:Uncharacterized protein n=2 Tax=Cryptococcus gattii TaxID=37769 RepID=E6RAP4_CRYGW|nr:Hypothetical Protein CGB_H2320W [Cryptococcus gattii WM276]ADV23888.1 Hypothetical Protein CGB_H2320W [Cryptococcus gattii WM276]KIR81474.1 hypothetical protein I306_01454 [Cryptococcus gattii EJB2]KIY35089.1 hypothetical protein I305_02656 [Cryptococcus gattii E566]KJE00220.1 hypothetical protein I311_06175 [Cryptococcus gattii NT-10]